ncbi:hypothetical protein N0V93_002797 [Gnomoniopsis smithogilvyi]|uniref:NADH:ubiquinone oxidoreductase intermediate-associated protein 30 domain-containing protein n=1 Tax=Gnomoniopsis smithogilvyi TaxID=1191159 RepID=A0A9W9CZI2_9PEZI|nr:hypothetical protein N0V93_002797 [Gnomoniopsis smithogilvyi]
MHLFGGDKLWDASLFTASDDRVRGGKSQSYLTVSDAGSQATFSGTLDIKTLGGAGFASQRTVDDAPSWDLSDYSSLVLDVAHADRKKYTITLKDEVLPKRPDGREQSTISWEYDFVVEAGESGADSAKVIIPFKDFEPTYRGKPKPDAAPLDLRSVKRVSFMMRSFFGTQEGDFSIVFNSVSVERNDDLSQGSGCASAAVTSDHQQPEVKASNTGLTSWIGSIFGWKI